MDLWLSKGYFPKVGETKTFEIVSMSNLEEEFETPQHAGKISIEGIEANMDDYYSEKRWQFRGELLEATVYPFLYSVYPPFDRKDRVRIELFGDKTIKKEITIKDISFTGEIFYTEKHYEFILKKVYVNGVALKYKTGEKEWEENYNVPYPSGRMVDVVDFFTGTMTGMTNQKQVGNEILDDVVEIIQRSEQIKLRDNIDAQIELQMTFNERDYQNKMKLKERRKKQTVAGLVGAFIIGIGYYFVR